jgi:hypothetical protein
LPVSASRAGRQMKCDRNSESGNNDRRSRVLSSAPYTASASVLTRGVH